MAEDFLLYGVEMIVFPGVIFTILIALFVDWEDRKLHAQMQNRIGPPFKQPLLDFIKLMAKESIIPRDVKGMERVAFSFAPLVGFSIALTAALFLPMGIVEDGAVVGVLSSEGDVLFLFFLLALAGLFIFIAGWATTNPLGMAGGTRYLLLMTAFEVPFLITIFGASLIGDSLSLRQIPEGVIQAVKDDFILIVPLAVLFGLACIVVAAESELVPFDQPHAETELVSGWQIEYTGWRLAYFRYAWRVKEFVGAGFLTAIFLGGAHGPIPSSIFEDWSIDFVFFTVNFLIKALLVVLVLTYIRTVLCRMRIDQVLSWFWKWVLGLSMLTVIGIIGLEIWVL